MTALLAVDALCRQRVRVSLLTILIATFLVLNCVDATLTALGLSMGAVEANPVMESLLSGGIGLFVAVKLLVGLAVAVGSVHRSKIGLHFYWEYVGIYAVAVSLYGWVCVHNFSVITALR
jgi:hypothetical protein